MAVAKAWHHGGMRSHAILLIVPSLAMSVVGVAMFGPGAARPFASVEIWGGPVAHAGHISLRILAIERMRGIDSAANLGQLLVRLRVNNDALGEARCSTDESGACDVAIDLPSPTSAGGVHADVYALPSGRELASGDLKDPSSWGGDGTHHARLVGTQSGYPLMTLTAKRGIFVAPFPDELTIEASPVLPFHIHARASGARLTASETQGAAQDASQREGEPNGDVQLEARPGHAAALVVTPTMHAVELEVQATREGNEANWTGTLPVVPGAMWLDPTPRPDGSLRVVSAVPRRVAYASIATEKWRLWGGAIALLPDGHGFESGSFTPGPEIDGQPRWLTLSSDPRGTGSGTVGWPLEPERTPLSEREHAFRDRRLLDGLPLAEKRDQERRGRARSLAWVALSAAACVEGALLAQIAGRPGSRRAWVRLAIALATVALAFSAIGVIVMWKTTS
jgi:hypothetical protein